MLLIVASIAFICSAFSLNEWFMYMAIYLALMDIALGLRNARK